MIISFSIYQARQLQIVLSPDDMVEEKLPSYKKYLDIKDSFGDFSTSVFALRSPTGLWSEQQLCDLNTFLTTALFKVPNLLDVDSSFILRRPFILDERLIFKRLLLIDCENPSNEVRSDWIQELQASPWGKLFMGQSQDLYLSLKFKEENKDDYQYGSFNPQGLIDFRNALQAKLQGTVDVFSIGNADYKRYVQQGIEEGKWLNLVFCFLLVLIFKLVFGTWKSGFLYIGSLLISFYILLGIKAFFDSPMDALSDSLFMMLGVASIEDFVFMCSLQQQYPSRHFRYSIRKLLLPSFMTSFSTFVGFASLGISDIHSVAELGIWAAVGSMLEWIIIFLVLPIIISLTGIKQPWVSSESTRLYRFFTRLSLKKLRSGFAKWLLLVFPVSLYAIFHLNTNDDLYSLFAKDHPFRLSQKYFSDTRGWKTQFSLVFNGKIDESKLEQSIKSLRGKPFITQIESSLEFKRYLLDSVPSYYHDPVLTSFYSSKGYDRYKDHLGRDRLIIYVNESKIYSLQAITDELQSYCQKQNCFIGGSLLNHLELSKEIPHTLLESLLLSVLIVSSILIFLCLGVAQGQLVLPVILSSFWGPTAMLMIIWMIKLPLNFLTCIFASVLVGLTGDNAINYLLFNRKKSVLAGVETLGPASVICLICMAFISLIFLGSYFDPPKAFGVLLFGGLLLALFGDLWIFKGLIDHEKV